MTNGHAKLDARMPDIVQSHTHGAVNMLIHESAGPGAAQLSLSRSGLGWEVRPDRIFVVFRPFQRPSRRARIDRLWLPARQRVEAVSDGGWCPGYGAEGQPHPFLITLLTPARARP